VTDAGPDQSFFAHDSLEIERKYLLSGRPAIPEGAEIWRIEQGYLSGPGPTAVAGGRIRRVLMSDGTIVCTHTIKQGLGVVRSEQERAISNQQFESQWPATAGKRLRKTRYRVREKDRVWEIDVFDRMDLVLAEVELPAADAAVVFPQWLEPHVVCEVTDDPKYTNAGIASRAPGSAI